jgi:hypothetical protein
MPPISHLRLVAMPPAGYSASQLNLEKRITYSIAVENMSMIPAQLPFFCVMDLGLGLAAHRDWQLDKIVSEGRKLIRCTYRGAGPLMPSGHMAACSLTLRIFLQDGIQVSLGNGAPASLDNMKDVRLFAITGAANFPAQRGQLLVTFDEVRKGLQGCFGHLSHPPGMVV